MSYRAEFEAGTIEFTSGSKPPTLYRNEGGEESLAGSTVDAFDAELSYFSECIATGHHAERCRMEDSAIAVRLTRALADARAHRGGKRGEWIEWL